MEAVLYFVTTSWQFLKTGTGLFSLKLKLEWILSVLQCMPKTSTFTSLALFGQYAFTTLLGQTVPHFPLVQRAGNFKLLHIELLGSSVMQYNSGSNSSPSLSKPLGCPLPMISFRNVEESQILELNLGRFFSPII